MDHVIYSHKNAGDLQYDFFKIKNIILELIVVSTPGTVPLSFISKEINFKF